MPFLIPILTAVAPWLLGRFIGKDAQDLGEAVIREVTGQDQPDAAIEALRADPAALGQALVRLEEIAAERERAILADMANARAQTVALAQAGSPLAWGAAVVSGAVMALFAFAVIGQAWGLAVPDLTMRLIEYAVIAVLGYWLGSSAGSARKDARPPLGAGR